MELGRVRRGSAAPCKPGLISYCNNIRSHYIHLQISVTAFAMLRTPARSSPVVFWLQRRCKSKTHWSTLRRKKNNVDRALENFDDFYGSVYGLRWRNMRAALLSEHKYIAMVNNFGDSERTCSLLELDGAISVRSLVNLANERMAAQPLSSLPSANSVDVSERLENIIRQKEEREKLAIYPEGSDSVHIPERLQFRDSDDTAAASSAEDDDSDDDDDKAQRVSLKKSLEEVMKDEMIIDYSRLVNSSQGSGALYDFVPANKIKGMENWVPESEHYKYYQTTTDFPLRVSAEHEFAFPEHLSLYTYEMGNCSEFKAPRKCLTGVLSHFLMDGASILPPLLLNVQLGERVLDACAAPGGKSLLMLQTLHPAELVCNDVQESRLNRVRKVMQEYLFDFDDRWENKHLFLNQCDARSIDSYGMYDKILVDVPCTTDRHSLMENDNNIFKPTRIKERLRLPELQAGILTNCLRLLRPGGSLVYSTCSLSPVQNDGVVHMALQRAFNDYGITAIIKDLSLLTHLFSDIFKFEDPKGLKYGQLVVPHLPANFGPMYFCKITRSET